MRRPRRAPMQPPAEVERALRNAERRNRVCVLDGISVYPPSDSRPTWRVQGVRHGKAIQRSGGRTIASATAAWAEVRALVQAADNLSTGQPENMSLPVSEAVCEYINQGGINGTWKASTRRDRSKDLRKFQDLCDSLGLRCSQLNEGHVRTFANAAASTADRGKFLVKLVATFVKWGVGAGYFTPAQRAAVDTATWQPPRGSSYRRAPKRREQAARFGRTAQGVGGEVPTHEQVCELAEALQARYPHGRLMVHTMANLGTRASETFAFTADASVAARLGANYVNPDEGVVFVQGQVDRLKGNLFSSTKNGRDRSVVIPHVSRIASGFDVQQALAARAQQALAEQAAGMNPLALIFPTERGRIWDPNNFNSRFFRPVAIDLGWQMEPHADARGNVKHLLRFTLHSLRDRYATTAVQEWGLSEPDLLAQGSWADATTVRRFYLGATDQTTNRVKEILHG